MLEIDESYILLSLKLKIDKKKDSENKILN